MTKHQSEIHIRLRETLKETHTVPDGYKVYVATAADRSQTMVNIWADGRVTVAHRENQWLTWGPPLNCDDMTWGK